MQGVFLLGAGVLDVSIGGGERNQRKGMDIKKRWVSEGKYLCVGSMNNTGWLLSIGAEAWRHESGSESSKVAKVAAFL